MKHAFQTARFELRPWEEADALSLAKYANNIKVWNNLRDLFPHPYTFQDAKDYIACVRLQPIAQDFAIVTGGEAAGGISILPQADVERFSAELGYWLGEPFWNKGIMTAAVIRLADYLFEHTNIVRLFASVFDHNQASARVLEKAGFRFVGLHHKAAYKNNRFIDMRYYELTSNL
ncbi:N-acetyltransferase [Bacteroidia bacterium]|nr:N-acetyltransferase [Bacteroidia bacterium]